MDRRCQIRKSPFSVPGFRTFGPRPAQTSSPPSSRHPSVSFTRNRLAARSFLNHGRDNYDDQAAEDGQLDTLTVEQHPATTGSASWIIGRGADKSDPRTARPVSVQSMRFDLHRLDKKRHIELFLEYSRPSKRMPS